MAEKVPTKITKKKVVRKVASKKVATASTSVRKKASTTTKKKVVTKTTVRKAPTPVAKDRAKEKTNNKITFIGIGFFLCVLGVSVAIGFSGEGQINIESAIANLKDQSSQEERDRIDSVSVPKKNNANRLVPSGVPVEVLEPEPIATSTSESATSTDATASSTDEVLEGELDAQDEATEEVPEGESDATSAEESVI